MRKSLLAVALLVVPLLAGAKDIPAMAFELGGSSALSFSSFTTTAKGYENLDSKTLSLETWGNFYVVQNFGIGLSLKISDDTTKSGTTSTTSRTTLVGPGLTYNFSVGEKSSVYVLGGAGYAKYDNDGSIADGWGLNLTGGVSYFPVDAFAVSAAITYENITMKTDTGVSFTTSGLSAGVGLSVFFMPGGK